jgi:hypothetical protein
VRYLRTLLGFTRLDRQRNPDIRNRVKVENILEGKSVSKELLNSPEANGQKQHTEAGFSIPPSVTARYGKTQTKMERPDHIMIMMVMKNENYIAIIH